MTDRVLNGVVQGPLVFEQHQFNDDGEYVPARYTVAVVTEIREPQKGVRRAVHHMSPEMARRRAAELLAAADEVEAKNAAL